MAVLLHLYNSFASWLLGTGSDQCFLVHES